MTRVDREGHMNRAAAPSSGSMTPRSRRPKAGPENELVERFLGDINFRPPGGSRITVFREPRLQSGFPDVVAVRWHEATAARWGVARTGLVEDELRLLHHLTIVGASDEEDLRRLLVPRTKPALQRLGELGLARRVRGQWRAAPLNSTFAVRSIIAFEAKVSSWAAAICQANLNRWFASESYVLVPRDAQVAGLVAAAGHMGVGVWVEGAGRPLLRATKSEVRQPISYASWLFNDWCWRESLRDATPGRTR